MNLCKTCKFWSLPKDESWRAKDICQPNDPDTFEPMKTDFEVRVCKSPKIVWFERQPESTGVSLIDGSDYYAEMLTAENFGCVNYEAGQQSVQRTANGACENCGNNCWKLVCETCGAE